MCAVVVIPALDTISLTVAAPTVLAVTIAVAVSIIDTNMVLTLLTVVALVVSEALDALSGEKGELSITSNPRVQNTSRAHTWP